eukprot:NODE_1154_length_1549_cov_147.122667_g956_i0.p1 GENE.NODE_1154_length_1549_cov_147.122667_g956_i0~~NODE_1154_length_1549_cov_147.122667_g956_i0.p1  ORF type:complete len:351 (-),score=57.32 NODE_1154_length_1549_cov_147.122667_g956_i0:337-1389(-)
MADPNTLTSRPSAPPTSRQHRPAASSHSVMLAHAPSASVAPSVAGSASDEGFGSRRRGRGPGNFRTQSCGAGVYAFGASWNEEAFKPGKRPVQTKTPAAGTSPDPDFARAAQRRHLDECFPVHQHGRAGKPTTRDDCLHTSHPLGIAALGHAGGSPLREGRKVHPRAHQSLYEEYLAPRNAKSHTFTGPPSQIQRFDGSLTGPPAADPRPCVRPVAREGSAGSVMGNLITGSGATDPQPVGTVSTVGREGRRTLRGRAVGRSASVGGALTPDCEQVLNAEAAEKHQTQAHSQRFGAIAYQRRTGSLHGHAVTDEPATHRPGRKLIQRQSVGLDLTRHETFRRQQGILFIA